MNRRLPVFEGMTHRAWFSAIQNFQFFRPCHPALRGAQIQLPASHVCRLLRERQKTPLFFQFRFNFATMVKFPHCGFIQARVLESDAGLGRNRFDEPLVLLAEDSFLLVPEKKTANHMSFFAFDRYGKIAHDREMSGWSAVVRSSVA